MKVDMSSRAVKARLKTVDELWLLSVKLGRSRKIETSDEADAPPKRRVVERKKRNR